MSDENEEIPDPEPKPNPNFMHGMVEEYEVDFPCDYLEEVAAEAEAPEEEMIEDDFVEFDLVDGDDTES